MNIREMTVEDIGRVLPLYIDYYNNQEEGCWTETTAGKRIRQVLTMEDSYSLLLEKEEKIIGFAMGYRKQYDDIVGYTLEEIIIATEYQNKGMGSWFMQRLEENVREQGVSCIELQAVKDEQHNHFYSKAGFRDAGNFVLKVKWFE